MRSGSSKMTPRVTVVILFCAQRLTASCATSMARLNGSRACEARARRRDVLRRSRAHACHSSAFERSRAGAAATSSDACDARPSVRPVFGPRQGAAPPHSRCRSSPRARAARRLARAPPASSAACGAPRRPPRLVRGMRVPTQPLVQARPTLTSHAPALRPAQASASKGGPGARARRHGVEGARARRAGTGRNGPRLS